MSDSRSRFEAWYPEKRFRRLVSDERYESMEVEWAYRGFVAGQADGRKEAAKRCVEWIDAFSIAGDRAEHMKHAIKAEFPEAFK